MENTERKNLNRGFKSLRVWQDTVELYCLSCIALSEFPFNLKKVASNAMDALHSISRNIAEGYCRKSIKDNLNFLNIALSSPGEFHSCYVSFYKAKQINDEVYEKIDILHYKVEDQLLKLIKS